MSTGTQTEVVMPQMGVSVAEGTITRWLRQVGDAIGRDEPLLEISTDKVDTDVPSPGEGIVTQILVQEGETVEVGTVLALIAPAGAEVAPTEPVPVAPAAEPAPPTQEPVAAAPPTSLYNLSRATMRRVFPSRSSGACATTPSTSISSPTKLTSGSLVCFWSER